MQVNLWNVLNMLFVCWLINVCVFNTCVQHIADLIKLQGIELLFSLTRFFFSLFDCVTSTNLLGGFAMFECYHQCCLKCSVKLVFICKIFQFLFTILDMLGSVLLYVIDNGILVLLFFPFQFYQFSWKAHLELLLYIVSHLNLKLTLKLLSLCWVSLCEYRHDMSFCTYTFSFSTTTSLSSLISNLKKHVSMLKLL